MAPAVTITIGFVSERFEYYNDLIFNGVLPRPRFEVKPTLRQMGSLRYSADPSRRDFRLQISNSYRLTASQADDVIVHEMIHLYIVSQGLKDTSSHGYHFRRCMDSINRRFGMNISITDTTRKDLSDSSPSASGSTTYYYIVLADLTDGRRMIASVARTCLHDIDDALRDWSIVRSHEWYLATSTLFCRYPRVRTPRLFIAGPELLSALRHSRRIIRNGNGFSLLT